jgi:hypothetical protein
VFWLNDILVSTATQRDGCYQEIAKTFFIKSLILIIFRWIYCVISGKNIYISCKDPLMHTFVTNTTLFAMLYSDVYQPSNCHPQGVRQIHFNSKINKVGHVAAAKCCSLCSLNWVLHLVHILLILLWKCTSCTPWGGPFEGWNMSG